MIYLNTLAMKLFYMALWMKQRATLGAQIAVLKDQKVLLVRHSYKPGWHLPGGGVDPPEAPEAAAERELYEETGLKLAERPTLLGVIPNVSSATKRDYITAFTACAIAESHSRRSREIAEIAWFPVDDVPADSHPMVGKVLARLRQHES
ncbi:hypothetical protein BJF92_15065 [Rhizobium rhizosphaerae]|uniref:Nudix hydrolase domain-containing protein n=1 Tax=Xaviernesmea rhizosphaerae TaxID=1672749 RepID=A0A1Q9AGL6_9HYPH|nr:NUDIX domain-containing protein [Xaviernesmea rhizosphaerae]OLP54312.1 hypothetical protein BJF92_15065 [Xaviernesmea rhizosphaerae]OQP87564.1 hypothetical protein BTR14_03060 [Xaviernesmea rhizosphaerae]